MKRQDDQLEILLDVTGLPEQKRLTEIVTSICAGAVVVLYSAAELFEEIRRWRTTKPTRISFSKETNDGH